MRKALAALIIILAIAPSIFGLSFTDTHLFLDETTGGEDAPGSFSILPIQYQSQLTIDHVVLRMGSRVRDFGYTTKEFFWSWTPGRVAIPLNPTSIDAIDFQGDSYTNDLVYISRVKEITIREGDSESQSDVLWTKVFDDNIQSVRATDYDGDGRVDDIIVAAGQKIYAINPSTNTTIVSFSVDVNPKIIAPATLDNDGVKNDIVIGTWIETVGTGDGSTISDGKIRVYYDDGNPGWVFPQTPLEKKVTYISAYDRDADGSEDDVIVIFTDDTDPSNPDSDLYITAAGSQVFFKANVIGVSPADFDGDGNLDDFNLLTKTQIFAYSSELEFIETSSKNDFNTSVDKAKPVEFLGLTTLSLKRTAEKNIFDDVAIFAAIHEDERAFFFVEDFAKEEAPPPTTSPPTTTPPTTTPPPKQAPTVAITGVSDGDILEEDTTYPISASASSDPDGEIVLYEWFVDEIKKGQGPEMTSFTLNTQGLSSGPHDIKLRVTDNDGLDSFTTITISVTKGNIPPLADAGDDLTVKEGSLVILSAEGSSDPDGEIELYEWSEDDTIFSLDKTAQKTFSVGIHTITLKVTDDKGASATDTVVITAEKENLPPKADAGEDLIVFEGTSVHLSAKESSDPDGDITSYVWSMPDGKTVTKQEFNATFPVGEYRITLNVTDDKGAIDIAEITITVKKSPGFFERIRTKYGSVIKITMLTLVALACAGVIFLRSQRIRGLY
jgi:hypothetical protein